MQVVMWGLLGASLGVAGYITHVRGRGLPLGELHQAEGVTVLAPLGWQMRYASTSRPRAVLRMIEPGPEESARSIILVRHSLDQLTSPAEYLYRNNVPIVPTPRDSRIPGVLLEPLMFGGRRGVLLAMSQPLAEVDEMRRPIAGRHIKKVFACTVLPTREVVMLQLTGTGQLDPQDVELVREIARRATVSPEPPIRSSIASVILAGGVRTGVPAGFIPEDRADMARTSKVLLNEREAGPWTSIELVPCFLPTGQMTDQDLLAMAAMHDAAFSGGAVRRLEPGRWKLDAREGSTPFPLSARIAAHESGIAVMAVFRAGVFGTADFDELWADVEKGLAFDSTPPVDEWARRGAAAVEELRKQGLSNLVPHRQPRWWMWTRDTASDPYIGWMYEALAPERWAGLRELRIRNGDGSVCRIRQEWNSDAHLSHYSLRGTHNHSVVDPAARDALAVRVQVGNGDLTLESPTVGRHTRPVANAFVPGAWLPMILARLPEEPLLLHTDTLPGCTTASTGGLLTVFVEPTVERPREVGEAPLRCLRLTVSGSGEMMYWYFDQAGQVQIIDLADGLHIHPTEPDRIRMNFDNSDGQMLPTGTE